MTEKKPTEEKPSEEKKKVDIKSLVALVPPPPSLKQRSGKTREKRIRLRWGDVPPEVAKISTSLAEELGIGDMLEVAVSGKKFSFKALKDSKLPPNEVYINEDVAKSRGISDNTIATVRALRESI